MVRLLSAAFLYGIPLVLIGLGLKAIADGESCNSTVGDHDDDDDDSERRKEDDKRRRQEEDDEESRRRYIEDPSWRPP